MALSRRVLAIDPGSRVTGYGIIDVLGQEVRYVDSGCIRLADEEMPLRLMMIHQGISELIRTYRPQEFAIEAIFVHKNPASALKLGQARGVAICAAVLAQLPVAEYAAKSIKQAVVGKGGAEKTQVRWRLPTRTICKRNDGNNWRGLPPPGSNKCEQIKTPLFMGEGLVR